MTMTKDRAVSRPEDDDDHLFYSRQEMAELYGVSYGHVGRLVRDKGVATHRKSGRGREVRYLKTEVDQKIPRKWRPADTSHGSG